MRQQFGLSNLYKAMWTYNWKMTKWILDKHLQLNLFWCNSHCVEVQETKDIYMVLHMLTQIIISELSIKILCLRFNA